MKKYCLLINLVFRNKEKEYIFINNNNNELIGPLSGGGGEKKGNLRGSNSNEEAPATEEAPTKEGDKK